MEEINKNLITKEDINAFLNGRDPQEGIVNLEYSYKDDFIEVYYRNKDDDKCVSREPFYPFLWATKHACRKLCQGDKRELRKLMDKFGVICKGLKTKSDDGTETQDMANGYTVLFYTVAPMSYSKFLSFFEEAGNPVFSNKNSNKQTSFTDIPTSKKDERQYLCVTPQEQFLIKTGKRFFKGYDDYDQVLRMIFDLETTGLDTHKDRIEQFGIRFNRPVKYNGKYQTFEKIFTVEGNTEEEKNESELKNLDTFMRVIYTFRPDIIVAHNGENFDWNMIINACERLGTTIEKVSSKYFHGKTIQKNKRESILKLGGEVETFNRTIVPGIVVTDSLHAVRRAQATDSNFLQATLKYSAKYLKLKKQNRVYVPGNMISKVWADMNKTYAFNDIDGDWYYYSMDSENGQTDEFKKGKDGDNQFVMYTRNFIAYGYSLVTGRYIVERYLLDDLWECDKVEYALNGTDFMLCKMIPVPYQKCCTMGTAGQWKAIMLAWSYENNLAIPLAENTGKFTGGLSRLLRVGYVNNVVKLDYNSLYPSIILTWGISDKNDIMNAMLYMLEYVLTTRETYKKLKKTYEKKCDEFKELVNSGVKLTAKQKKEYDEAYNGFKINDNRQMVVKKLGNSFFGSYGSNNGSVFPWKSVDCAERTTCTGRQSLRLMISHFKKLGYEPIVGDSVTGDTPLFIRYKDTGYIDIKPIDEIMDDGVAETDYLGRKYDTSDKPYQVLCRNGWQDIKYVYSHETNKDIYEINDGKSSVECTQDHSLFDENKKEIKPTEITEDTKLEYYRGEINHAVMGTNFSDEIIEEFAKQLAHGTIDRVPYAILNCSERTKMIFYKTFMKHQSSDIKYSKTCLAGLLYLSKK